MALRDYLNPVFGPPESEDTNARGELKDAETASKKSARRATQRKGRASLFEAHPSTHQLLPLKKHFQERIQLKPQHGRTWHKTYRIREELDARTRTLHVSHRKLNKLAKQISGKPIDYAILQMQFSEKRISEQVRRLLLETKQRAKELEMNLDQMVVSQAWVGKGHKMPKKIDIRARGRYGVIRKSRSHLTIRLGRGLTEEQVLEKRAQRALDKVRIAELVKDEKKVRYPRAQWAW